MNISGFTLLLPVRGGMHKPTEEFAMKKVHEMSFEEFEQHMSTAIREQQQAPGLNHGVVFLGMVEDKGEMLAEFGNVFVF